ncbi:hypothetical protein PG996_002592 [Apiospora saccharicola]|uniref:Uncharacterized protein n=1 Tax=Apiospora saccharicola TaxID=335842 RepID=A0ABR1WMX8_9PEZI
MSGALLPAPKSKKGAIAKAPLSSKNTKKKKNNANTDSKAGPFSSTTASPTSQSGNEHFFSPESVNNNDKNNKNNKNKNHVSAIRGGFLDTASPSVLASSSSSSSRADPSTRTDRNNIRKNKVDIRVHLTSGWRAKISLWGDSSTASSARGNDTSEAAASASASSGQYYYPPIDNESDEYDNKTKNTESASLMSGWRSNASITKDDDNDDADPFTVPGSIARATPEPMWR